MLIKKGKTNLIYVAIVLLSAGITGILLASYIHDSVAQGSEDIHYAPGQQKKLPVLVIKAAAKICGQEFNVEEPSDEDKVLCAGAKGEWSCKEVCTDPISPSSGSGCRNFCTCVCPKD